MVGTTTVCGGAGDKSYQYKVTVAQKVNNYFGGIFGIGTTTVRATAQAEYIGPLKMGSPSNQFGNDPDATPATLQTYPNFWGNIAGGSSVKQKGDAYAAGYCDVPTDGCSGIGPNKNLDFNPLGYVYAVDFKSTQTVNLQAFDPDFVNVGDTCTTGNLAGAAALANVVGYPQGAPNKGDRAVRYGSGSRYCTGDNLFTDHGQNGPPPNTTYTVLKAAVPGDPSSATAVPGCPPITYTGYTGDIAAALTANLKVGSNGTSLAQVFRQWATLCNVTGQAGDEYFIQVSTDAASQGHNRFSLRASGGTAGQVAVAGNAYMGIYANVGGNQLTQFYLARVPTAASGHTLVLNFFDIGDASSQGTLQVIPPADAKTNSGPLTRFTGCQWTGNASGAIGFANNTPTAPWGNLTPLDNTCTVPGVNAPGTTWNAAMEHGDDPHPERLHVQRQRPQRLLAEDQLLVRGRRRRHDLVERIPARRPGPARQVARGSNGSATSRPRCHSTCSVLLSGPGEPGLGGEIRLHAVRVGTAARGPRTRVPRLQASPEITFGVAQVGAHAVVATAHLGNLLIDCVRGALRRVRPARSDRALRGTGRVVVPLDLQQTERVATVAGR